VIADRMARTAGRLAAAEYLKAAERIASGHFAGQTAQPCTLKFQLVAPVATPQLRCQFADPLRMLGEMIFYQASR